MSRKLDQGIFFWLSGPPGSGKTTLTAAIEAASQENKLTTHVIPEFPKFIDWVELNKGDTTLITWVDDEDPASERHFELTEPAYQQAFDYVSFQIANEFRQFSDMTDVTIVEAARAIKGVRYYSLFQDLVTAIGDEVKFVNFNVDAGGDDELRRRVISRSRTDKLAAPLPILNLYLADAPFYPSSVQDASLFGDHFIWNDDFDNSDKPSKAAERMRGVVGQIVAMQMKS